MKWRWHRSLVFWAGFLVMGFLTWAWGDSCWNFFEVRRGAWLAASFRSGVFFSRVDRIGSGWKIVHGRADAPLELSPPFLVRGQGLEEPPFSQLMIEFRQPASDLKSYYQRVLKYGSKDLTTVYVPYWLIMAVAGVIWMGLLRWRWRKAGGGGQDAG